NVEQDSVRSHGLNASQGFFRTVNDVRLMTLDFQQHRKRVCSVGIVIHDQDALRCRSECRSVGDCSAGARDLRQPDFKRRALLQARAARAHLAAMHLNQILDDRETDPKSALGTIERALILYEEIKYSR